MSIAKAWNIAVVALAVLAIGSFTYAAEHPSEPLAEHPAGGAAEHPAKGAAEHPTKASKSNITKDELADAIEDYVEKDAALKGGHFLVYDAKAGKPLALKLQKVHKERLSSVGHDVYFACADFETPEGKVYDLDIFMKGPNKNHLVVTEISVHKEAGVERYTWFEHGGIWKKSHAEGSQPKGSAGKREHPAERPAEHPKGQGAEHPTGGAGTHGSGSK